jgi:TatD DNase family protein
MPRLIDTHCHLQLIKSSDERAAVLTRMEKDDVWAIAVGTGEGTSAAAIELARKNSRVWATVGYHPEHLTSSFEDEAEGKVGEYNLDRLTELAKSDKRVVAIGETGLDFYRIDNNRNRAEAEALQARVFLDHLKLALDLDLPVVMHCRDAFPQLTNILRDFVSDHGRIRGVVHCFVGPWNDAKPLLDLGLHLSFTGIITFPQKKSVTEEPVYRDVIRRIPADRFLIETDAPWLAPVPHRGESNEPCFVQYVAKEIAAIRNVDVQEIERVSTENARKLFRI